MQVYFDTFDIPLEYLSKEITVFYDEFGNIKDVVNYIVKKTCLGHKFKSYLGTILTDKSLELTVKMIDNYLIYEYKHFKGFFPGDSSGGGSGPSPTPGGSGPPIGLKSASAVDVAKGWLKVNGTDLSQCTNAIAITLGEGNKMYAAPGVWAAGSGMHDKAAFLSPAALPQGEPGGPWQLTGLVDPKWGPYTSKELSGCSDDPDWITCQAKWAKRYVESDMYPEDIYNDYTGCVNALGPVAPWCVAGDPKQNCTINPLPKCCVGHHKLPQPVTKIFDNSLGQPWCGCPHANTGGQTIGFSGRCESGHPANYYTAWLPIAKNVCQAAMK